MKFLMVRANQTGKGNYIRSGIIAGLTTIYSLFGNNALAQEIPKNELKLNSKTFNHISEGVTYPITIVSDKDVNNVEGLEKAIEIIREDDSNSAILAGDFSDEDKEKVKNSIIALYKINPKLISLLEPIFFKLQDGNTSAARPNFGNITDLSEIIKEYCGKKYDDVVKRITYKEKVDSLKKDLIDVPTTEEEYISFKRRIADSRKNKDDSLDAIFLSKNRERTIFHELAHLIFGDNDKSEEVYVKLKGTKYSFIRGAETFEDMLDQMEGSTYVATREKEVESWQTEKGLEMSKAVELFSALSEEGKQKIKEILEKENPNPVTSFNIRVLEALKNFKPETLREHYLDLINEAALDWNFSERVAEGTADIATNDQRYQTLKGWAKKRKELDDIEKRMLADYESELEEETEQERKERLQGYIDRIKERMKKDSERTRESAYFNHMVIEEFLREIN